MKRNRLFFAMLIALVTYKAYGQEMMIHIPFDENAGTMTYDATPNGNDGTFVGDPTWIEGKIGSALSFDGLFDYDSIPGSASISYSLDDHFTIATWFKLNEANPLNLYMGRVAAKAHAEFEDDSWSWQLKFGKLDADYYMGWQFNSDGQKIWADVEQYLNVDEWYHVAATYDGYDVRCYLNGVETESIPMPGGLHDADHLPLLFGADGWHIISPEKCLFAGCIDDFKMYSEALTTEQLEDMYYNTGGVQVSEIATNPDISIHPNPVNTILTVGIENEWRGMVTYTLFDDSGRLISTEASEKVIDKLETNLDMTELNEGIYIIDISCNGTHINKKVNKL